MICCKYRIIDAATFNIVKVEGAFNATCSVAIIKNVVDLLLFL
jgi:hypothetical protein